jgi:hypothetical protein
MYGSIYRTCFCIPVLSGGSMPNTTAVQHLCISWIPTRATGSKAFSKVLASLFHLSGSPNSWLDLAILITFVNVRGMLRHDVRTVWLVGNYHLLHHQYPNKNYGEGWLDWLGGTQFRKQALAAAASAHAV